MPTHSHLTHSFACSLASFSATFAAMSALNAIELRRQRARRRGRGSAPPGCRRSRRPRRPPPSPPARRRHLHRGEQRVEPVAGWSRSSGTPITGSVVCAATTPARCAAAPAPTMNTAMPRAGAPADVLADPRRGAVRRHDVHLAARRRTPPGARPRRDMTSQSLSLPISTADPWLSLSSSLPLHGATADVAPVVHAVPARSGRRARYASAHRARSRRRPAR